MNVSITQSIRPIRLAFLIKPNEAMFARTLKISSALWGGVYFPVIPIYERFSPKFRDEYSLEKIYTPFRFYKNTIDNYDPEILVIDSQINPKFIEKIKGDYQTIDFNTLEKGLTDGQYKYGISIEEIIKYLGETEFKFQRNDNLKIVLSTNQKNLFWGCLLGIVTPEYFNVIKSFSLPTNSLEFKLCNRDNLAYFENGEALSFLKLGKYKLSEEGNFFWTSRFAIFIIDPNRLNDLINFWNLRALGWSIIAIPILEINNPFFQNQIVEHQKEFSKKGGLANEITVLKGATIKKNKIDLILSQLSTIQVIIGKTIKYMFYPWFPRFWLESQYLNFDKTASVYITSEYKRHNLISENMTITIPILQPPFLKRRFEHTDPLFVNEVAYFFDDFDSKYAHAIPQLSSKEITRVFHATGKWRASKTGLTNMVSYNNEYLSLQIPKANEIFSVWFKSKNLQIDFANTGKLINQLLHNIGGVYGINFFASIAINNIINLFQGGAVVKQETIWGEIKKYRNQKLIRLKHDEDVLKELMNKGIIQFGAFIQCSICSQHTFYPLSELQEEIRCSFCQSLFKTPIHLRNGIVWAYRGVGSFSRNNKADGVISVLLTLRFLRVLLSGDSVTSLLNFKVKTNSIDEYEIDLAIIFKKSISSILPVDTFFCECKTIVNFKKKDILRMKTLAELFPGTVIVFSTLKFELTDKEKKLIVSFAKTFRRGYSKRPINPILILTGNELLQGFPANAFGTFSEYDNPYRYEDEIGHLCDASCAKYLGLPSYQSEVFKKIEKNSKTQKGKT